MQIVDDVPAAANDAGGVTEDGALVASGNVLDNDVSGADTPKTFVSWDDAASSPYGTVALNANGSYTFTLDNTNAVVQGLAAGEIIEQQYDYTMRDADGDTSPATLTITITGADDGVTITGLTPKANGGDVVVDEDDLSDGTSPDAPALTQAGDFTISAPDGLDDLTVGGTAVITDGVFTATSFTTPLGNTLAFTAYDPASGQVSYTYTLADNETHGAAGEDGIFEDFAVLLTDTDGSSASDTLSVQIVDDVPSVTLAAKPQAAITLDESLGTGGSVQNEGGAVNNDEAASADPNDIGYAKVAAAALFTNTTVFGADGPAADHLMRIPGCAPLSGASRKTPGPSPDAASTMPSDRPNFILRGARLATITVRRPTSFSGA